MSHTHKHRGGKYVIAYELFKGSNNNCQKHSQGIFLADVGLFTQAYTVQNQYDSYYQYGKNKYGNPDAMDYTFCRAYNGDDDGGSSTYVKLGCSSTGGLKLITYSDSSCTTETTNNLGLYNDAKVCSRISVLIS
jgi:hypothetical protein